MITDRDIEECIAAAAALALFFVGTPENEVLDAMPRLRDHMKAGISEKFGADVAGQIAEALVAAVLARRREIEAAGGATSRVLN